MITLHHCPQTRSMRTLWLLHELDDVEFQVKMHAFDRSLRDPEYLVLSPAGRVPAANSSFSIGFLKDDGLARKVRPSFCVYPELTSASCRWERWESIRES